MKDLVAALNPPVIYIGHEGNKRLKVLDLSAREIALRSLVEKWFASGPDLRQLFREDPQLEKSLKYGKTTLWSAPTGGRAHLDWTPQLWTGKPSSASSAALKDFAFLITNPQWKLLSRPCPRCTNYFLKIGRRSKYCSAACASRTTAKVSVYKKRKDIHDAQIMKAQATIRAWNPKTTYEKNWKKWVARKAKCSVRWITRHINLGNLKPPLRH